MGSFGESLSENVASAILADVEPGFQPAEKPSAINNAFEITGSGVMAAILPGGRMPPSTAGQEARRYIFRQALKRICHDFSARCDAELNRNREEKARWKPEVQQRRTCRIVRLSILDA